MTEKAARWLNRAAPNPNHETSQKQILKHTVADSRKNESHMFM